MATQTTFLPSVARPINFDVIRCTSADPSYPAQNLHTSSIQQKGWVCERFSDYPQRLILELKHSTYKVEKLDLIAHQHLVPRQVDIYIGGVPQVDGEENNNNNTTDVDYIKWTLLGHINFASPEGRGSAARELKGVFLEANCRFIRLDLQRPHISKNNLFGQISLCNVVPYGTKLKKNKTDSLSKQYQESIEQERIERRQRIAGVGLPEDSDTNGAGTGTDLDPISRQIAQDLALLKEDAINYEDYHSARDLKNAEQQVRAAGRNIVRLLIEKNVAIQSEDFDRAAQVKAEISRLKHFVAQLPLSLGIYKKLLEEREAIKKRENRKRKQEYQRRYKWNDKQGLESLGEFTGVEENNERGEQAATTIQRYYQQKRQHSRGNNDETDREETTTTPPPSQQQRSGRRVQFVPAVLPPTDAIESALLMSPEFDSPNGEEEAGAGERERDMDLFESVNLDQKESLFQSERQQFRTQQQHLPNLNGQQQQPLLVQQPGIEMLSEETNKSFVSPTPPTAGTSKQRPMSANRSLRPSTLRDQGYDDDDNNNNNNNNNNNPMNDQEELDLRMIRRVPNQIKQIPKTTVPNVPLNVQVTPGYESATVNWEEPNYDGGSEIIVYQIQQLDEDDIITTDSNNVFEYTIEELEEGIQYMFKVCALNEHGPSEWSPIVGPVEILTQFNTGIRPTSREITGTGSKANLIENHYPLNRKRSVRTDKNNYPLNVATPNEDGGGSGTSQRPISRQLPKEPKEPTIETDLDSNRKRRVPDPWDGIDNTRNIESPEPLNPAANNSTDYLSIKDIFGAYVLRSLLSENWKLRYTALRKAIFEVESMPEKKEFSGKVLEAVCKIVEMTSHEKVVIINMTTFRLFALVITLSDGGSTGGTPDTTRAPMASQNGIKFDKKLCRARIKTYARAQMNRLGDSNERISTMAQQCLDIMCDDSLQFIGTSIVVPLLRENNEDHSSPTASTNNSNHHPKAWRHVLGRLNYVQLLISRYHFSTAGFMTTKDVVNMMIECEAGMHANASVREQAKLLCTMIKEHEDEREHETNEDDAHDAFDGVKGSNKSKSKSKSGSPGSRARLILEPFLSSLYDDRRKEFTNEIFGDATDGAEKKTKKNSTKKNAARKKKKKKTAPAKKQQEQQKKPMNSTEFGVGKEISVIFQTGSLGLGLGLGTGFKKCTVISELKPNGQAIATKQLLVGDEFSKIDGVRVTGKTIQEIVALIGSSKRPCKFVFLRK